MANTDKLLMCSVLPKRSAVAECYHQYSVKVARRREDTGPVDPLTPTGHCCHLGTAIIIIIIIIIKNVKIIVT